MSLESELFDLRVRALSKLPNADFVSTVDNFSTVRFLANLRPENQEAVFSSTHHTAQAADIHAFDAGLGDTGQAAGFGPNTTMTPRHTNLRQKRKPNDSGKSVVQGLLLVARGLKKPTTTTNANTISDDSDNQQTLAPDAVGYVRERVAALIAEDYSPYIQKTGGMREYLAPIRWEATESGILYALYTFPEGYTWGGAGQGSEMLVGFERTHLTYNVEWAADTDRPWEDIADGLGVAPTGAQPAAGTVLANLDVACSFVGGWIAGVRP